MKNLLFVIDSLTCGGAEKSLISLLNNMDYSKYKVDLLLFRRGGEFEKFLPKEINLIDSPEYFSYLVRKKEIELKKQIIYKYYRFKTSINLRVNNIAKNQIHSEQVVYNSIKNVLNPLDEKYDLAVAYSQGFPTYFVSEKVKAKKKLAWINCNYVKTKYDKDLDNKFYNNIDKIIVVSKFIYDSMSKMKYNYERKMKIILDIVDPKLIDNMAYNNEAIEFNNIKEAKILTVGRLAEVKGYDLVIKAASLLKKDNYKFKWFIIGEGPERQMIESLIMEYDLKDYVVLLGLKSNPYPYMKNCNIYVQTSRKEGFGLTVIEAKILQKVIVSTDFDTIYELITNNFDGVIAEKNEKSIYLQIKKLLDNKNHFNKIQKNIKSLEKYSTVKEVSKFYEEIV